MRTAPWALLLLAAAASGGPDALAQSRRMAPPAIPAPGPGSGPAPVPAGGAFAGLAGGDYLEAILSGDPAQLRARDRDYTAGLQPMVEVNRQMARQMAPLMEALSGGRVSRQGLEERMRRNADKPVSILPAVLATYLSHYERLAARCLRPDHAEVTITITTPDVVRTNGLGIEVSRTPGGSSSHTYRINREFEAAFRREGTRDPQGLSAQAADRLYNSGRIQALLASIPGAMQRHSCDGDVMRRFDANLLALYDASR